MAGLGVPSEAGDKDAADEEAGNEVGRQNAVVKSQYAIQQIDAREVAQLGEAVPRDGGAHRTVYANRMKRTVRIVTLYIA